MSHRIELQAPKISPKPKDFRSLEEYKKSKRLAISCHIQEILNTKRLNRTSFAQIMDVQPSIISRWLSGTHNFNLDTLIDIEYELNEYIVTPDKEKSTISLKVYFPADTIGVVSTKHRISEIINYENPQTGIDYSPLITNIEVSA